MGFSAKGSSDFLLVPWEMGSVEQKRDQVTMYRAWAAPPGGCGGRVPPGSKFGEGCPPEIVVFKENFKNFC